MTFTYSDSAVARHFESDDSEDLTHQLNQYFQDLATRDADAQVTVLSGPEVWGAPDGLVHALLIVKSDHVTDPYEGLGLGIDPHER